MVAAPFINLSLCSSAVPGAVEEVPPVHGDHRQSQRPAGSRGQQERQHPAQGAGPGEGTVKHRRPGPALNGCICPLFSQYFNIISITLFVA